MQDMFYFTAGFRLVGARNATILRPLLSIASPKLDDRLMELVDLLEPPIEGEVSATVDQDNRVVRHCGNIAVNTRLFRGLYSCACQGMDELIAARAQVASHNIPFMATSLVNALGMRFAVAILFGHGRICAASELGSQRTAIQLRPTPGVGKESLLIVIDQRVLQHQPLLPNVLINELRLHLWATISPLYGVRFRTL